MAITDILSRLDKVKPTGRGRWMACCPAHDDRTPSMVITETDGRVLMHCFAECSIDDILGAIGVEMAALFPPRSADHAPRVRRPWNPADILAAVAREALITAVAASAMANGKPLTDQDRERLLTAASRLQRAHELAHE